MDLLTIRLCRLPTLNASTGVASQTSIAVGGGTEPLTISSLTDIQGEAAVLLTFDFTVTDDGVVPLADNSPSLVSQIVIGQAAGNVVPDWMAVLGGAQLFDGVNPPITGTVNMFDITFSAMPFGSGQIGEILDDAAKTYELSIWLQPLLGSDVIDNDVFEFFVNDASFTMDVAGSQIGGGPYIIESGPGNNAVDVVAEQLVFDIEPIPTTIGVEANFTTDPVVGARDSNNNLDQDYDQAITVTNGGTLPMNNDPTSFPGAPNGQLTFPFNFSYGDAGVGTLIVTDNDGTLPDPTFATSTAISVQYSDNTTMAFSSASATISSLQTGATTGVFSFDVRDDLAPAVNDAASTKIPAITIGEDAGNDDFTDWSQAIVEATLSDGIGNSISAFSIGTNTIVFTGIDSSPGMLGDVPDDMTKTYTLNIRLNATMPAALQAVIDGDNFVFEFDDTDVTLAPLSSTLASNMVNSGATNIEVEVLFTEIRFTVQPGGAQLVAIDVTPAPVVRATDFFGNTDTDHNDQVVGVTTTPVALPLLNAPSVITNGVMAFAANFQYLDSGDGTLFINDGAVATITSDPVTVTYTATTTIGAGTGTGESATISSLINAAPGQEVFDFAVVDDNGSGDDGSSTFFTQIVINEIGGSIDLSLALAGAQLDDGSTTTQTATIGSSSITFTSLTGTLNEVTDNSSKEYTVSIWLNTMLGGTLPADIDGMNFQFEVTETSFS